MSEPWIFFPPVAIWRLWYVGVLRTVDDDVLGHDAALQHALTRTEHLIQFKEPFDILRHSLVQGDPSGRIVWLGCLWSVMLFRIMSNSSPICASFPSANAELDRGLNSQSHSQPNPNIWPEKHSLVAVKVKVHPAVKVNQDELQLIHSLVVVKVKVKFNLAIHLQYWGWTLTANEMSNWQLICNQIWL